MSLVVVAFHGPRHDVRPLLLRPPLRGRVGGESNRATGVGLGRSLGPLYGRPAIAGCSASKRRNPRDAEPFCLVTVALSIHQYVCCSQGFSSRQQDTGRLVGKIPGRSGYLLRRRWRQPPGPVRQRDGRGTRRSRAWWQQRRRVRREPRQHVRGPPQAPLGERKLTPNRINRATWRASLSGIAGGPRLLSSSRSRT